MRPIFGSLNEYVKFLGLAGIITINVLVLPANVCCSSELKQKVEKKVFPDISKSKTGNRNRISAVYSLLLATTNKVKKKDIFGSIGMPTWEPVFSPAASIGSSLIANWKFGKQTSLTISYDDSSIGNALYGVPGMAEKSLVGTWFVNPGSSTFQKMSAVWHQSTSTYHQEIANHTMNHAGGTTEAEALAAINDASTYIKEHIYQVAPSSNKLLGFNKAGGTEWDIPTTGEAWDQRIRENYLIERKYSTGFYKAMPVNEMKIVVKAKSFSPNWSSIHFHGICDDLNDGNLNTAYSPSYIEKCTCTHIPPESEPEPEESDPDYLAKWTAWVTSRFLSGYSKASAVSDCLDGGTGAVKKSEIYEFYSYLADQNEIPAKNIWIAGYIEAQKYAIERDNATVTLLEADNSQIRLNVTLQTINQPEPLNQIALYDEDLTIFVKVPSHWTACRVTQNGESHTYIINGGETRFEISPGGGECILVNDTRANIDIPYVGDP